MAPSQLISWTGLYRTANTSTSHAEVPPKIQKAQGLLPSRITFHWIVPHGSPELCTCSKVASQCIPQDSPCLQGIRARQKSLRNKILAIYFGQLVFVTLPPHLATRRTANNRRGTKNSSDKTDIGTTWRCKDQASEPDSVVSRLASALGARLALSRTNASASLLIPLSIVGNTKLCSGKTEYQYASPKRPLGLNRAVWVTRQRPSGIAST